MAGYDGLVAAEKAALETIVTETTAVRERLQKVKADMALPHGLILPASQMIDTLSQQLEFATNQAKQTLVRMQPPTL